MVELDEAEIYVASKPCFTIVRREEEVFCKRCGNLKTVGIGSCLRQISELYFKKQLSSKSMRANVVCSFWLSLVSFDSNQPFG